MKFGKMLAEMNKLHLLCTRTVNILERKLPVKLGPILIRLLYMPYGTILELRDLDENQIKYLVQYNSFMIYYPGMGLKALRELQIALEEYQRYTQPSDEVC